MSSSVFVSRLRGLPVLDSAGDQVGQVRDVIIQSLLPGRAPRAKGLVASLFAKHRIFVPMGRVHQIDPRQVVISGVVDTRKFQRRSNETLVLNDLVGRSVEYRPGMSATIYDLSLQPVGSASWEVDEVALRAPSARRFRRAHTFVVHWRDVPSLLPDNNANSNEFDTMLAQFETMKPADVARELYELSPERRVGIAKELSDELLANALEELPEDEQVSLIQALDAERAADILDEMDPDDAADLIADLSPEKAEELLGRMQPDEAEDVRQLLLYDEFTAGGMMTPEPVILGPDNTVADALAQVRSPEHTPALAASVFVCRAPLDAPTGRFIGGVHFQRLLREPPSRLLGGLVDENLQPIPSDASLAEVSRYFATYNLVVAPVVDARQRLVGAVSVDDVLDHMLPEDWRGVQMDNEVSDDEA